MATKLYHQVGHFPKWNIESFDLEKCGDGLILSPVHQTESKVESLPLRVRRHSLFDPQFYLPNSQKPKLSSYAFFPENITSGFSTKDFPLVAMEAAEKCVSFQRDLNFEGLIIPARFIDRVTSKYFENQEEYTVVPFLKALERAGGDANVILTVPLTSEMLRDDAFRTTLLNWITGFPELTGVYILVHDDRPTKQIQSSDFLSAYLSFVRELSHAGLRSIAGHLNTESLLFTLIDDTTLTFGSFENTRIFSMDKFIEAEEERRAPRSRIYLPSLLNWVQYDQAMQIKSDEPTLWSKVYTPTSHGDAVIAAKVDPYFTQPGLYKHHFLCLQHQVRELTALPVQQRYERLKEMVKNAMALNREISSMPLDLDHHGSGDHLQAWLDSLNAFYRRYLKS